MQRVIMELKMLSVAARRADMGSAGGHKRDAVADIGADAPTPSSGSPLVDRLVGPCLTKNPDARSPRMQRVIMELKMLSVAARRADMGSAGGHKRDAVADIGAVREEM